MTTDDALQLAHEKVDPAWVLDLRRFVLEVGVIWEAVAYDPFHQSDTLVQARADTPHAAATALYELLP